MSISIFNHDASYFIFHRLKDLVALFECQITIGHQAIEEDLDVNFVIGTVYATDVIHEVRVNASTFECKLDTTALSHTKVTAFADDFSVYFTSIDT
ncbi:Uncharacterised protein [Vibrio cholerae]|uniref:Uncharacterized protein n=1 Tax=Vibrio cholerae TaxID=666 RepID=A0A655X141_VIBCL|nr:Uncharacterised protein [Vibrio cholerae]